METVVCPQSIHRNMASGKEAKISKTPASVRTSEPVLSRTMICASHRQACGRQASGVGPAGPQPMAGPACPQPMTSAGPTFSLAARAKMRANEKTLKIRSWKSTASNCAQAMREELFGRRGAWAMRAAHGCRRLRSPSMGQTTTC